MAKNKLKIKFKYAQMHIATPKGRYFFEHNFYKLNILYC